MHTTLTVRFYDTISGEFLFVTQKVVRKDTPAARCALINRTHIDLKKLGYNTSNIRHVFA